MTDEERESLVLMVSRGQSTYGEIRAAFPNVAEYTWRLCGKGAYPSSDIVICRRGGDRDTELRDEEVFELTDAGRNLLHRIEKERHRIRLNEESVALARESNRIARESMQTATDAKDYARRANYIAITVGVVSLLVSVLLQILLH